MPKKKKIVSTTEYAKMLGISRIAVFKKIKNGQLPAEKVGRSYIIHIEDIDNQKNKAKKTLSAVNKQEIEKAVKKVVKEYGETLRLLGKE
ncbi:MAG: excisionase family DNA-binding protein [Patescibacteria group bacterium]|nr:excisionase family DNA-binding protein [Patescibacteria group bacterium]